MPPHLQPELPRDAGNNRGESVREVLGLIRGTWDKADGIAMVDYSSQEPGRRQGKHAKTIDLACFHHFLE